MTAPPEAPQAGTPPASAASAQSRLGGEQRPPASRAGAPLPLGRGREGEHFTVSPRALRGAHARAYERLPGEPLYRPLRVYTRDPSTSRRDGAVAVVNVPYEPLAPGPVGALIEVVDDGAPEGAGPPLDLDERGALLQQGRTPSPTDAGFKRQMVYAVCSTTYMAFRQALGRDVPWGFDRAPDAEGRTRLRVRPCADTERNAYYDRRRGELRFGVYTADALVRGVNVPRGIVSTCLAHDVVVHEMSHALLDGLRARFTQPTNPDVLAFHEAFADLVAVFQRFTYRDVVLAGVRGARGDVREARLLTDIATQFGETTGMVSALRSAVAGTDCRYGDAVEPHELGAVLVAAVFAAFATVYRRKAQRLVKLATGGSGVLAPGDLPDALVDALADVAGKTASQFLALCIRGIDYAPPVDITFGEYLRALVSADADLVPDDAWGYREALIDAFRGYGIYPMDVPALSEDALLWREPDYRVPHEPELGFARLRFAGDPARPADEEELARQARALGQLVADPRYSDAFGLVPPGDARLQGDEVLLPVVETVRSARRTGPAGQIVFDLVAEVIQLRRVRAQGDAPAFDYYGGATVILGPTGAVRYVIRKSIVAEERLARQRAFVAAGGGGYWGLAPNGRVLPAAEPFRLVHGSARKAAAASAAEALRSAFGPGA